MNLGLWKIRLKDATNLEEFIFWAYNFNETAAKKAAMTWITSEQPGRVFAICGVDKQPKP